MLEIEGLVSSAEWDPDVASLACCQVNHKPGMAAYAEELMNDAVKAWISLVQCCSSKLHAPLIMSATIKTQVHEG